MSQRVSSKQPKKTPGSCGRRGLRGFAGTIRRFLLHHPGCASQSDLCGYVLPGSGARPPSGTRMQPPSTGGRWCRSGTDSGYSRADGSFLLLLCCCVFTGANPVSNKSVSVFPDTWRLEGGSCIGGAHFARRAEPCQRSASRPASQKAVSQAIQASGRLSSRSSVMERLWMFCSFAM